MSELGDVAVVLLAAVVIVLAIVLGWLLWSVVDYFLPTAPLEVKAGVLLLIALFVPIRAAK